MAGLHSMGSEEGSTMRNVIVSTVHLIKSDKSRKLTWAGHETKMEEVGSVFKILTGISTRNTPLGKSRRRCEDNIIMDLQEKCVNTRNWVDSAQDKDN